MMYGYKIHDNMLCLDLNMCLEYFQMCCGNYNVMFFKVS